MPKIFRKDSEIPSEEKRIEALKAKRLSEMTTEERDELIRHYAEFPTAGSDKNKIPTLEALDNTDKLVRPLEKLFDGNLCIAESHDHISPKKFLTQNMRLLKDRGYDVLFMEHFCYREHQDLIDQYFASSSAEMPKELAKYLDELTRGHMTDSFGASEDEKYLTAASRYNFRTILEEAKRCGLKVVCAEKDKFTYKCGYLSRGPNRMAVFNHNFRELVKEHEADHGSQKWVLFVGNGHVNSLHGVPGICEIIPNVQEFVILDCDKKDDTLLRETAKKEAYKLNSCSDCFLVSSLLRTPFDADLHYDKICMLPKQAAASNEQAAIVPSLAVLSSDEKYDDLSSDSDSPQPSPNLPRDDSMAKNNPRKRHLSNAQESKSQTTRKS